MADVELNSIGNGDGTNYLVRDNTKIPLSGTNALAGSIIPDTDNTVNLGSISYNFKNINTKLLSSSGDLNIYSSYDGNTVGSFLILKKIDSTNASGSFQLNAHTETQIAQLIGYPNGTLTWGGTVFTNGIKTYSIESRDTSNSGVLYLLGGSSYPNGAQINLYGNNHQGNGSFEIIAHGNAHYLRGDASGTLTWDGQPIQYASDQRLKQQITQIDNALLDAWEDVNPVQFKYNDAVDEKGDKARLHTGYVVQQIDEACKEHNVDISKYGLYCHEEYKEETREVEHDDGTKTVEVVRPASEHYSLRYTEALIVECAYLRKKNKDLQEQLNALSERLEKLENR